jgi:hypothetical protein
MLVRSLLVAIVLIEGYLWAADATPASDNQRMERLMRDADSQLAQASYLKALNGYLAVADLCEKTEVGANALFNAIAVAREHVPEWHAELLERLCNDFPDHAWTKLCLSDLYDQKSLQAIISYRQSEVLNSGDRDRIRRSTFFISAATQANAKLVTDEIRLQLCYYYRLAADDAGFSESLSAMLPSGALPDNPGHEQIIAYHSFVHQVPLLERIQFLLAMESCPLKAIGVLLDSASEAELTADPQLERYWAGRLIERGNYQRAIELAVDLKQSGLPDDAGTTLFLEAHARHCFGDYRPSQDLFDALVAMHPEKFSALARRLKNQENQEESVNSFISTAKKSVQQFRRALSGLAFDFEFAGEKKYYAKIKLFDRGIIIDLLKDNQLMASAYVNDGRIGLYLASDGILRSMVTKKCQPIFSLGMNPMNRSGGNTFSIQFGFASQGGSILRAIQGFAENRTFDEDFFEPFVRNKFSTRYVRASGDSFTIISIDPYSLTETSTFTFSYKNNILSEITDSSGPVRRVTNISFDVKPSDFDAWRAQLPADLTLKNYTDEPGNGPLPPIIVDLLPELSRLVSEAMRGMETEN